MILEEFINLIKSIGFKPMDSSGSSELPISELVKISKSITYSLLIFTFCDYRIIIQTNNFDPEDKVVKIPPSSRWSLEHNLGIIDSPTRKNVRNFELSDLELINLYFKYEIRNNKLNQILY
jgi:hypothetical protein